ncbi:dipeptidase PepV [Paenibacillus sp.]|jgi:succinyl-diaminopimelate desuccinylase|uniref:dipeptidase PepV n=1 Tax=Paenibacillus sp. TaxID=58172 RepID=UPI0028399817|nr:dipeptidase PepV [Paenibacillus sp.]MDR0269113.1 dipeptidase PepV [Paenibacillus sp.]
MNWYYEQAQIRKDGLLRDLKGLLAIPSVYDPATAGPRQPMGKGVADALRYMLDLCAVEGFRVTNHHGLVGYAEYGPEEAEHYIAVLSHLDVVPVSGEWVTPPFEPAIRDGKIYARGAIDDKGPAMASFYALKIVKALGLPLKHRIRLIFGTDEERTHQCMERYKELEPMPAWGFTPDAEFPIIAAEKGQINTRIMFPPARHEAESKGDYELISFHAGVVANMVPEAAEAVVTAAPDPLEALEQAYQAYCSENKLWGSVEHKGQTSVLHMAGKAAHGMEPHLGMNAGLALIHFLKDFSWNGGAGHYLNTVDALLYNDVYGRAMGIAMEDDISGPLTVNSGILAYEPQGETFFHINLRFPICGNYDDILKKISEKLVGYRLEMEHPSLKKPHHVPGNHPMIRVLQETYLAETGEKAELLSTGGGTYAAHFPMGVAFGPLFPGMESTAHQPNEYMDIELLLRSTAIYARAVSELGNLEL